MSANYWLIIGYGLSGRGVASWCDKHGIPHIIYDSLYNKDDGADFISFMEIPKVLDRCKLAIVSPGFNPKNSIVALLIKHNIKIMTDIDILNEHTMSTKVAVTGTNGKSTVTSWLDQALNIFSGSWKAMGNIGVSVLSALNEPLDGVVIELSSAQLYYSQTTRYDYGLLLPISTDHLDWHSSEEEYIASKMKLLHSDKVIVHDSLKDQVEDKSVRTYGLVGDVKLKDHHIVLFSGKTLSFDPDYYWRLADRENLCAVMATLEVMGIEVDKIPNFDFLPYRARKVTLPCGWIMINDSKATNLHATNRTMSDVRRYYPDKKIVLLLGGVYKEEFVIPDMNEGDKVILFGKTIKRMDNITASHTVYSSLFLALNALKSHLMCADNTEVGIVIFAPGGASFDEFSNYAHRGKVFDVWIGEL